VKPCERLVLLVRGGSDLDDYLGHLREFRRILQNLEGQSTHSLNRDAIAALTRKLDRDESQLNTDRLEGSIRVTIEATHTLEALEHYEQDVMAVFRETTTKKRHELERKRFRKLLDQSGDSIFVVEPYTGRFLDVNQTATRVLGYTREELLELSLNHIEVGLPLTPAAAWHEWVQTVRKAHNVLYIEGMHRRHDGARFPVEASVGFATADNEELLLLVTRDIAARKRSENRIRRQWGFFSRLVHRSVDGIMAFDRSFNVTYWNPAIERLLGVRRMEVQGKNIFRELPHLKELGEDRYFRDALAGASSTSRNRAYTHGETGRQIYFDGYYSPLTDESGEILGGIGIFRDVTDRRETQLRQTRDAIARIDQQRVEQLEVQGRLEREIARLEEENQKLVDAEASSIAEREKYRQVDRSEELEVLARGVARAVRPLVDGILSQAGDTLSELPLDSSLRRGVEEIEHAAGNASELASTLSAFAGNGYIEGNRVQLDEVLDDLEHSLRSDTGPNVFLQRPKPDGTLPLIHGDPQEIEKLVRALVNNAAESFGEEGGKVVIKTGTADVNAAALEKAYLGKGMSPGRYVFLEVADNGAGIADDIRPKVFVPFFTTKTDHTGLGLAAVLGIMRAHRGALTLESEPEQGSVVRVFFPVP